MLLPATGVHLSYLLRQSQPCKEQKGRGTLTSFGTADLRHSTPVLPGGQSQVHLDGRSLGLCSLRVVPEVTGGPLEVPNPPFHFHDQPED